MKRMQLKRISSLHCSLHFPRLSFISSLLLPFYPYRLNMKCSIHMNEYRSLNIFLATLLEFPFLKLDGKLMNSSEIYTLCAFILLLLLLLLNTLFIIVIFPHLDRTARTLLSLTFCNLTPLFQPLKSFSSISLRTMALSLEVRTEKLSVCVTRTVITYMALKESKYTYMSL